jgi:hypothetical protein
LAFVQKDKESKGRMRTSEFKALFSNILRTVSKEDKSEVYELLIPILKDEKNEEEVLFEKLNTLCDLF